MDSDRDETNATPRTSESAGGLVVRATRRGALVLETENARRMRERFASLRPVREAGPEAGAAPAR
jgi:hypothetical protein